MKIPCQGYLAVKPTGCSSGWLHEANIRCGGFPNQVIAVFSIIDDSSFHLLTLTVRSDY